MEEDQYFNFYSDGYTERIESALAKSSLSIYLLNIRSVKANYDELVLELDKYPFQFDMICLTETWFNRDNPPIPILNYNVIHIDRLIKVGGGNAIYVNKKYDFKEIEQLTFIIDDIEILSINIKNINIHLIYRPPNGNIEILYDGLERLIDHKCGGDDIVILGDFNVDISKYASENSVNMQAWCNSNDILLYANLLSPTRVTKSTSTIIDFLLSNRQDIIFSVHKPFISDHNSVIYMIPLQKNISIEQIYTSRNYNNRNIESFTVALSSILSWNYLNSLKDVNEAFDYFHTIITVLFEKYFPKISMVKKNKFRNKWITKEIRKKSEQKRDLAKQVLLTGTEEDKENYRIFRNKFTAEIRKIKKEYYSSRFINMKTPKDKWAELNRLAHLSKKSNNKRKIQEIIKEDQIIHGETEIANEFANVFADGYLKKLEKQQNTDKIKKYNKEKYDGLSYSKLDSFFMDKITRSEIMNSIGQLNNSKSVGYDEIPAIIIKKVAHVIVEPLQYIFNLSITQGVYPTFCKHSIIIPIYKQGNKQFIENYRPITLLSVFSKIFDKIIFVRLKGYLEKYKIIDPRQFAFQQNKSTTKALIQYYEELVNNLDNSLIGITVFMDLSKAFDVINLTRLCYKLSKYGLRGIVLDWFRSYVNNRTFQVKIDDMKSSTKIVTTGIPQGSTLGPLLFTLYINDLFDIKIRSTMVCFADDITITNFNKEINEVQRNINADLELIKQWIDNNEMYLNINKSYYILFKNKNKVIEKKDNIIQINDIILEQKNNSTYLGLIFDENLNWNLQTDKIILKISKKIGIIRSLIHVVNKNIILELYYMFIYSELSYAIEIWGNTGSKNIKRILQLQKKFLRMYCDLRYYDSVQFLFKETGILNIKQIFTFKPLQHMYKEINTTHKNELQYMSLTEKHQTGKYNTRNKDKISIPIYRRAIGQKSINYQTITQWNELPQYIKEINNFKNFKLQLRNYVIAEI